MDSETPLADQVRRLLSASDLRDFERKLDFAALPAEAERLLGSCSTLVWQWALDGHLQPDWCGRLRQPVDDLLIASEAVRDLLYETMNGRRWNRISTQTRYVYGLASLYRALLLMLRLRPEGGERSAGDSPAEAATLERALNTLDMGLIYSPPLCGNLLARLATLLHDRLVQLRPPRIDGLQRCQPDLRTPASVRLHPERLVPTLHQPDLMHFYEHHLLRRQPVLIRGAIDDWPALSRWTLPYLLSRCAGRLVPVEIGRRYTDLDWGQRVMSFERFMREYIVQPHLRRLDSGAPAHPADQADQPKGYCAQYELFDRIECLADDFYVPDYCALGAACETADEEDAEMDSTVDVNAWFGPADTVSPLHFDPKDNLFAQVLGRKYVRLYSPRLAAGQDLYACDSELLDNTSEVDVERLDRARHPRFPVDFYECVVRPGDLLYIPKGYWHYVRSLDVSFSISFWWNGDK